MIAEAIVVRWCATAIRILPPLQRKAWACGALDRNTEWLVRALTQFTLFPIEYLAQSQCCGCGGDRDFSVEVSVDAASGRACADFVGGGSVSIFAAYGVHRAGGLDTSAHR